MKTTNKHYKAVIQYDGSDFYGFQVQRKQYVPTVQKVLEDVCRDIFGHDTSILASGRTDKGVHAMAQVIAFRGPAIMPTDNLLRVLNARIPDSIRFESLEEVNGLFHPIACAKKKTYKYFIDVSRDVNVFERNYIWQFKQALDISLMQDAANELIGEHDFAAFAQSASSYDSCVRTICDLRIARDLNKITVSVTGSGFLRGMVRNIVALLVQAGQNQITISETRQILELKDRGAIGPSAPASGLYLWKVYY